MFAKRSGILGVVVSLTSIASAQVVGPMVGQVGDTEARFFYRTDNNPMRLKLTVMDGLGKVAGSAITETKAASDYTAHFHIKGLSASTGYTYQIEDAEKPQTILAGGSDPYQFRTFPVAGEPSEITLAFASCANAKSAQVWGRMNTLGVDGVFLMGDTPSIDQSDLPTVRKKHREFLLSLGLDSLIRHTPTCATWDDHEFGQNNGNGKNVPGKAVNRQGFMEYRANAQYGTDNAGIYYSAPCGPVEIFMLDTRWFSQTEPSPADPSQPTCFGKEQWKWLLQALKQSKAPFKVLAMGAIWQDKKNNENDDMHTYWYERDALFDYIRDQKIPGVVLLGGDILVSRHLIHRQRVGYDLHDFITAPASNNVIPSLDVYHPDLEWSSKAERQFLTLHFNTRVHPAVLTAKFHKHDGTIQRTVTIPYDKLEPKSTSALSKELRAYWPFDGNPQNQSVIGGHLDAASQNGASILANGGARGGAASLNLANQQYFQVRHNVLPDTCSQYTVSLWAKPTTLPAVGSNERSYLIESTPADEVTTGPRGFGISLGLNGGTSG